MFGRKTRILFFLFVVVVGFVLIHPPVSAQITTCADLYSGKTWTVLGGAGVNNVYFHQGDTMTVVGSLPAGTTAGQFQIEQGISGPLLAGPISIPGTLLYTVPSTGYLSLFARVVSSIPPGSVVNLTIYFSCTSGQPTSTPTATSVVPAGTPQATFTLSVPAPKYFNPGDNRVNPRPGDRLAVWCSQPDMIVVYGIDNEGKGFELTTFSYQQVVAAGPSGVTKNLGFGITVSLSVDQQNNFWLAWNGSRYGNFAKSFSCNYPRLTQVAGRAVDQTFFADVLGKLGLPVNEFSLKAMQAWQASENTSAWWNPLATTWKMPGSSSFNSVGVQNFPERSLGVDATANTLGLKYYDAIRAMLRGESFDREGLRKALVTWSGVGAYVNNLLDTWKALWDKR